MRPLTLLQKEKFNNSVRIGNWELLTLRAEIILIEYQVKRCNAYESSTERNMQESCHLWL
jgi:hypothetical protein